MCGSNGTVEQRQSALVGRKALGRETGRKGEGGEGGTEPGNATNRLRKRGVGRTGEGLKKRSDGGMKERTGNSQPDYKTSYKTKAARARAIKSARPVHHRQALSFYFTFHRGLAPSLLLAPSHSRHRFFEVPLNARINKRCPFVQFGNSFPPLAGHFFLPRYFTVESSALPVINPHTRGMPERSASRGFRTV